MSSDKKLMFCNPLPLPSIPRGMDDWMIHEPGMFNEKKKPDSVTCPDYRSVSDPTVFFDNGRWYLYPSYGMAWISKDFATWEHVKTDPYCPKYSPSVCHWKDKYLMASWGCPLYEADDPLGPFRELGEYIMPDGSRFNPCDPGIFADEDGRIYLYAVVISQTSATTEGMSVDIVGYELDAEDPRRVVEGPVMIVKMNPEEKEWERHGRYRQERNFGWVEGPHLLKRNGRYYMIYASADTCDPSYCMAVYYSDTSPLHGFVPQKRNPLTYSPYGLVSGAGHGCVERGPGDTLWAFYTIAAPVTHMYERRIGMDLVDVDEYGELYCPHGVTDTPQYAPGVMEEPTVCNTPHLYNLTARMRPSVSSATVGREGIYATDESNLTWWQPEDGDEDPKITIDLSGEFKISSARVYFREIGLDYDNGVRPQPVPYVLKAFGKGQWITVVDNTSPQKEMMIDFRQFETVECTAVSLELPRGKDLPYAVGVVDLSVFGKHITDI